LKAHELRPLACDAPFSGWHSFLIYRIAPPAEIQIAGLQALPPAGLIAPDRAVKVGGGETWAG
jgi:hypothetical protein